MSDIEKKADASKAAIKTEAVELHDDDLDAVAGGAMSYSENDGKKCSRPPAKDGQIAEQFTAESACKSSRCGSLSSNDIDFIKGTKGKG